MYNMTILPVQRQQSTSVHCMLSCLQKKKLQNFNSYSIVQGLQINFKTGCQEGIPWMGQ